MYIVQCSPIAQALVYRRQGEFSNGKSRYILGGLIYHCAYLAVQFYLMLFNKEVDEMQCFLKNFTNWWNAFVVMCS